MKNMDEYREKVEDELRLIVQKGSTPLLELDTMFCYHMGFCSVDGIPSSESTGKYLRPMFVLAVCAGLGGNPDVAIPAAAALELVHKTTLIFDDIQDKGEERNGRPSVWKIWGTEQAINAGFALSCYARLAMFRLTKNNVPAETVLGIESVLENAVIDICDGQYRDISLVEKSDVKVEDYMQMAQRKTAALFGTACAIGGMIAQSSQEDAPMPTSAPEGTRFRYMRSNPVVCNAWNFGVNIGMAFQIHDDYLGIWGDEAVVGKTANDIQERKRSLPIVLALQAHPKAEITPSETLRTWLSKPSISKEAAADITAWLTSKKVDRAVIQWENHYTTKAAEYLQTLNMGEGWSSHFENILEALVERQK